MTSSPRRWASLIVLFFSKSETCTCDSIRRIKDFQSKVVGKNKFVQLQDGFDLADFLTKNKVKLDFRKVRLWSKVLGGIDVEVSVGLESKQSHYFLPEVLRYHVIQISDRDKSHHKT